jgi:hypothetical protein
VSNSGRRIASQYMAGTAVSTEMRSASIARSHSPASNAGISTVVPAARQVGSHCTRLPITWKSGAGTRFLMSSSGSHDSSSARRADSAADSIARWVSIAPFGWPVVPLV